MNIGGEQWESGVFLDNEEVHRDLTKSWTRILEMVFNRPIIVEDYMQFAMLTAKYKTNTLVVYCDPKSEEYP